MTEAKQCLSTIDTVHVSLSTAMRVSSSQDKLQSRASQLVARTVFPSAFLSKVSTMSIHPSLKTKSGALNQHRNVLTRDERVAKLTESERFVGGASSPLGLPKVLSIKITAGKKPKKEPGAEAADAKKGDAKKGAAKPAAKADAKKK